jgi:ribosomal protein L22
MERWEAERVARAEARKKAREDESNKTPASATPTPTSSTESSGAKRTLRRTETQKAIEQNLDDWEEERKVRPVSELP